MGTFNFMYTLFKVAGVTFVLAIPLVAGAASQPVLSGTFHPGAVSAGGYHSLGLKSDGTVEAWGLNSFGQRIVPVPNSGFLAVAGGELHSLGLKSGGVVAAWGRSNEGQLAVPLPNTNFAIIAAGGFHSLALRADGTVVAWGRNTSGQTNVPAPNGGFVAIAAGRNHSLALKEDRRLAVWGSDNFGQSTVPAPNTNFIAMAGGEWHSLGLKADGTIVAWGRNHLGQLDVPAPNSNFVAVAAGFIHSLGLKSDGSIVAWGDNGFNQVDIPEPNSDFVAIAANGYHSLALRADGSVVAWGRNTDGQTNVPLPNADFGIKGPGVSPPSGSVNGGYAVTIHGYFLAGDITNAMLAGIPVSAINSQSSTQVVVTAGSAPAPVLGDVQVFSVSAGTFVIHDAFRYIGEQVITFPAIGDQVATNVVVLSASASSGLPVSFAVVEGPAMVSDGSHLTFTGSGTVSVVASQSGNDDYYAAAPVTNTFAVERAPALVTLNNLAQTYDGTPRVVTASTVPDGLIVDITYDGETEAPVNAGTYPVLASVQNAQYQGSTNGLLSVSPAIAEIMITNNVVTYDGEAKPVLVSITPDGLSYTVTYDGNPWAPTNAGEYLIWVVINESNYVGAVSNTLSIAKAEQNISFGEIADQIATNTLGLAATASSGLPVGFSVAVGPAVISGGTNLGFSGSGLVGISATQSGDANWNPAGGTLAFFNVNKADQFIDFSPIPTQQITNTLGLAAVASSGLPVAFTVDYGPAVISGGVHVAFLDLGEVLIIASQPGNAIWNPAPEVLQTFEVEGTVFWLEVFAGPHGTVDTESGWKSANTEIIITAIPDPYYDFDFWTGDVSGGDEFSATLALFMDGPKVVNAFFAEQTTGGGVSIPWLVGFGITNDFEQAVLEDPDGDGVITGDEYLADTNPTDGDEYLSVDLLRVIGAPGGFSAIIGAEVSTNRIYNLQSSPVVPGLLWSNVIGYTSIAPSTSWLVFTNEPTADGFRVYRFQAGKP